MEQTKKPTIKFNDKEVRYATNVEMRMDEETTEMILEGYALTFNSETLIGSEDYGYIETIDSASLNETDMRKVPMKYNHNNGYLAIASTKNGSLKLSVDTVGLRFEARLINTQANRDVHLMVKEGLLSECSFAFITETKGGSEWDWDAEPPRRTIKKIKRLYDVALVDIPAYDNTSVSARSLEAFENVRETVEAEKRKQEALKNGMLIKIKLNMEEK